MSTLTLRQVTKTFSGTDAVRAVSLDVASGEFFSLLGPSGCGKTTLLRMVAGFESPTAGSILIDGADITHTPAQERGIGMVFQHYALFPHMTVFGNVAFGLETQKIPAEEVRSRVNEILDAVGLSPKAGTPVPHLSGGEQQRVAVARALVVRPRILLFDEPLSNLDVALRLHLREEIRRLQRMVGITTLYVTHDQSEAMSLSDRIAVMRAGAVEQTGTPRALYEQPSSPYVAGFFGGANIIPAVVTAGDVAIGGWRFAGAGTRPGSGGDVIISIRPEAIALHREGGEVKGRVTGLEFQGFVTHILVEHERTQLRCTVLTMGLPAGLTTGETVGLSIDWQSCVFFPAGMS